MSNIRNQKVIPMEIMIKFHWLSYSVFKQVDDLLSI